MALFNRNKTKTVVLPELKRYYDAERRERSGLAWILALVSVAGVAVVLIGVFFGSKWLYRRLTTDKPDTVAVVQTDDTKTPAKQPTASTDTSKTDATTGDSAATTPAPSTSTPAASTPTPTPTASTPAASTPAAGGTSSTPASASTPNLANTGPENVIPAFMTVVAASMFIYRVKMRSSKTKKPHNPNIIHG